MVFIKKKFNLKILNPKKIKFCPKFSIFKEKLFDKFLWQIIFFILEKISPHFNTVFFLGQFSFLWFGTLDGLSFLLQMNVSQINVKNLFWDFYSVMRCYARKLGEKTFLYSKEKEGISLTRKYLYMYYLQRNYKNPNTHNIHVPMLEANYKNPKHPSF